MRDVAILAGLTMSITVLASLPVKAQWGPYGESVERQWALGHQLEEKGDFNSAQIVYERALEASRNLSDPLLRDCAIAASTARRQGAMAAREYIRYYGDTRYVREDAYTLSQTAFRQAWNEIDQARPDLASSCP